jgi:hypothetical protein
LVSFAIGRWFGSINSPQYDSPDGALMYLISHVHLEKTKDPNLYVDALPYRYTYHSDSRTVQKTLAPLLGIELWNEERRPRTRWKMLELERVGDFLSLSSVPAGAGLIGSLSDAVESSKMGRVFERYGIYVVVAVSALSGGIFGYYSSFHDGEDYNYSVFQDVMLNPVYWEGVYFQILHCDATYSLQKADSSNRRKDDQNAAANDVKECENFVKWITTNLT